MSFARCSWRLMVLLVALPLEAAADPGREKGTRSDPILVAERPEDLPRVRESPRGAVRPRVADPHDHAAPPAPSAPPAAEAAAPSAAPARTSSELTFDIAMLVGGPVLLVCLVVAGLRVLQSRARRQSS